MSKNALDIERFWELGAMLHDIQIASDQSAHVVRSVKELGAPRSDREPGLSINDSIQKALSLLSSPLRKVQVRTNLAALPEITGNKGEQETLLKELRKKECDAKQNILKWCCSAGSTNLSHCYF